MSASNRQRETELKYNLQTHDQLTALQTNGEVFRGYRPGPTRSVDVLDIYWDTPDYALLRGGFGLRTRLQNDRWRVTLKSMGKIAASGVAERTELEVEADETVRSLLADDRLHLRRLLAPLMAREWPPADWEHVVLHEADPPARPYALLRQRRDRQMLHCNGDEPVAEASFDTVQIFAPSVLSPATWDQHKVVPDRDRQPVDVRYELEVEAQPGADPARWADLTQHLAGAPALRPAAIGKAEEALRLLARLPAGQWDGPARIQADMPMSEAGRSIWREQLAEVLLNEPGVRRDRDEDAVHDLRVAIRRMRAAERIFGGFFAKSTIKPLRDGLRATAKALGPARDLDVSLARLQEYRAGHGVEAEADEGLGRLAAQWEAQRCSAYDDAVAWLASSEYSQLVTELDVFCRTPGAGARSPSRARRIRPRQVRHVIPAQIPARYAAMRAYEPVIGPNTPVPTLHALRIEGKRLRYCLEFVRHLLEPGAAALLVEQLKAIQDTLGAINDAHFTRVQLQDLAGQGFDGPSLQQYRRHQEQIIESERAAFAVLWGEFLSAETRRQLALAVAAL